MDLALKFQPFLALLFAVGFVLVYSIYGKWWKTAIGRHMVGFMGGCAVLLFLALIVRLVPELQDNVQLKFWGWNVVIALFAWRFWVAVSVFITKNFSDIRDMEEEDTE